MALGLGTVGVAGVGVGAAGAGLGFGPAGVAGTEVGAGPVRATGTCVGLGPVGGQRFEPRTIWSLIISTVHHMYPRRQASAAKGALVFMVEKVSNAIKDERHAYVCTNHIGTVV